MHILILRFFFYFKVMKDLIFATHNAHKANEIQSLLEGIYRITDLRQLDYHDEIPEDRDTLEGNAVLKAQHIFSILKKNCFADDTGLEVECMNGAPGVYSARYAEMSGEKLEDESASEANIRILLNNLKGETNRRARFRTVICLILEGEEYLFEGIVEGSIIEQEKGNEGFGYDPVFMPEGHLETFAEMSLGEKNRISHRARAVKGLAEFLRNRYEQ